MTNAKQTISTRELLDAEWQIAANPANQDHSATIQTIYSKIPNWTDLNWAEQTYYQAKYRFDNSGELQIDFQNPEPVEETWNRSRYTTIKAVIDSQSARHRPNHQPFALPGHEMPGSQDRLRTLILQPEVAHEPAKHDQEGAAHIGPDRSVIYTNTLGWGIPDLQEPDINFYEFDYKPKYFCQWNPRPYGQDEVPCWTTDEKEG